MTLFKRSETLFVLLACLSFSIVIKADDKASKAPPDISAIYQDIRKERTEQSSINKQRESMFLQNKAKKQTTLNTLKKEHEKQEIVFDQLKENIENTQSILLEKKLALKERTHALKDLFSAWKQVVKDSKSNLQSSLLSHQFPDHLNRLTQLSEKTVLPTANDLEALSSLLQLEIKQTAQSVSYQNWVLQLDGSKNQQNIERIGPFTASSQGSFLIHDAQQNSLSVAIKQPSRQAVPIISSADFQSLAAGSNVIAVIDPSRGVVLERLSLSPSWQDRIHQGGYIGYAIIILGIAGLLLALARGLVIASTRRKIQKQLANINRIDLENPLGKIIAAYQNTLPADNHSRSTHQNTESLEVRLQEIVLQEMPRLDKGIGSLKLLAAVAPLLGLLGTVVGMINTFQTITLVGNADPKLMAGGISQALMTTVLGLIVAVPLLFSHSYVAARSREVMVFLSQQSLGYIARSLETNTNTNISQNKEP